MCCPTATTPIRVWPTNVAGAGNRDLEAAGLAIILRNGLDDPIAGLIARLREAAEGYANLNLVSRALAATDHEKASQAAAVSGAADQLATQLHQALRKATAAAAHT